MSLVLNSSGGGSVTLQEPVTATPLTQDIVAVSGSIPVAAASGVLNAGAVSGSLCRAWVNFNGNGTAAIRAAFNVSSITDNGTGDYTLNFTTPMPDANYAFTACGSYGTGTDAASGGQCFNSRQDAPPTTTQLRGGWKQGNSSSYWDTGLICVSVFR